MTKSVEEYVRSRVAEQHEISADDITDETIVLNQADLCCGALIEFKIDMNVLMGVYEWTVKDSISIIQQNVDKQHG